MHAFRVHISGEFRKFTAFFCSLVGECCESHVSLFPLGRGEARRGVASQTEAACDAEWLNESSLYADAYLGPHETKEITNTRRQ